ncbi:hypothetical protein IWQ57_007049, partial [Coemansia nantahalensis]
DAAQQVVCEAHAQGQHRAHGQGALPARRHCVRARDLRAQGVRAGPERCRGAAAGARRGRQPGSAAQRRAARLDGVGAALPGARHQRVCEPDRHIRAADHQQRGGAEHGAGRAARAEHGGVQPRARGGARQRAAVVCVFQRAPPRDVCRARGGRVAQRPQRPGDPHGDGVAPGPPGAGVDRACAGHQRRGQPAAGQRRRAQRLPHGRVPQGVLRAPRAARHDGQRQYHRPQRRRPRLAGLPGAPLAGAGAGRAEGRHARAGHAADRAIQLPGRVHPRCPPRRQGAPRAGPGPRRHEPRRPGRQDRRPAPPKVAVAQGPQR